MLTDEHAGVAAMSVAGESLIAEIAEVPGFSAASALFAVILISGRQDHA